MRPILFYFILLHLIAPYLLFSLELEKQTNAPVEISLIMESSPTALSNNMLIDILPISNSITLLESSNNLQLTHNYYYMWAIPVQMNWTKIPEVGFSKNEITAIHIIKRTLIEYEGNKITFVPNLWLFKTKTWEFLYEGRIPYLENLEFLDQNLQQKLSTKIIIVRKQNGLGYYQDSNRKLGVYFSINNPQNKNIITSIFIVSTELQTNINTSTLEDTIKNLETSYQDTIETLDSNIEPTPEKFEKPEEISPDLIDPSATTSVEKRDKQKTNDR